ncbi:MAG TPA: purine-nucleoside phosphorylase [Chryseosolibacter sp.]|nr:purine-nucleoside phosphorylase [Chryseosolibacter sp.]
MISQIDEACNFLKHSGIANPEVGIILGTGLGGQFVNQVRNPIVVEYSQIPYFPIATVEGHKGRIIYGTVADKKVIALQGRFHYYEGYAMTQITFPVRVMKLLGIKTLLISNAAGNLNREWKKGELMLINDHINLQPDNPLRGKNDSALGPRFPDMSQPYDQELRTRLTRVASVMGIPLRTGVYVAVTGPNLETRAEYRFLRMIGADAVGMSTVPEVIVANHMSLPCCAVSVLTDDCDPDNLHPVDISLILAIAADCEPVLSSLFVEFIRSFH